MNDGLMLQIKLLYEVIMIIAERQQSQLITNVKNINFSVNPTTTLFKSNITDYNMKQRLDLETLLRKYENNYLLTDPHRDTHSKQPKYQLKSRLHKVKTEANFYPTHDHYYNTKVMRSPQRNDPFATRQSEPMVNLNFQMSKSECQNLLLGMREELKNQQKSIEGFISMSVEQSIDKFERVHQQLRIQLLNLLQHSLDINRKLVLDYLTRLKTQSSKQYSVVYKKIANIDSDLSKLLAGLNGNDYKKTIAEVVTKDYIELLKSIRTDVTTCNANYKENLMIPPLDRTKIKHFQDSLQNIYEVGQQRRQVEDRNVEELDLGRMSRRSSKKKIFQSRNTNNNKLAITDRNEQKKQSRQMRRTFFNFDPEY